MNPRLAQEADISPVAGRRRGRGCSLHAASLCALLALVSPSLGFDHTYRDYAEILAQYVDSGRVDYAALCGNRAALDRFLGEASVLSFEEYQSFSRDQQKAFMLNLYNAAAIALVCDRPGMRSIQQLKGVFRDAWSVKFIRLFDRTVGLAQLLHDILRSEFKDTRIHFAIVTAASGDPHLPATPYRAEILNRQLDDRTDAFMTARPDINRYENGVLYLSPKFKWYAVDFGDRAELLRFARRYFPQATGHPRVVYTPFDWSLNRR